jgi:hypothetical protein
MMANITTDFGTGDDPRASATRCLTVSGWIGRGEKPGLSAGKVKLGQAMKLASNRRRG